MLPTLSTARFATLLAVVVTLFASGVVAGAAGASLILGATNDADSAQTTLRATTTNPTLRVVNLGSGRGLEVESTSGAPLRLIAPSGTAAIAVNTTKKIDNLNADRLDGLSSERFARSDVEVTGHFQCSGFDFIPVASTYAWSYSNGGRYFTSGTGGWFDCGVHLPDGATITALRGYFHDTSAEEQVACWLYRNTLLDDGDLNLAYVQTTDVFMGGDIEVEDLSVNNATVDNSLYRYRLNCGLYGNGSDTVLLGAGLEYTIAGLPVE